MASRLYGLESSWNRAGQQIDEVYEELIENGVDKLEAKINQVRLNLSREWLHRNQIAALKS